MRQRRDLNERRCGPLPAEELLADWRQVDAIAHVRDVGRDLHDARHRATLRLDERLDRLVRTACLRLEIAAERRGAVGQVGNLPGQKEDCLCLCIFDPLAIGWRFEQVRRTGFFDWRHVWSWVLGAWCSVLGPWVVLSLGTDPGQGRTLHQGRTKHQAPRTKDSFWN